VKPWEGELPTGDNKRQAVQQMFDAIAPRYDRVNRIMTFRLDVRWRKIAVRSLSPLPKRSRIADLASGTGDLCIDLRNAEFVPVSVDLSFGMLSQDRSGAPRVQGDVLAMPFNTGALDGVTCGFALRNFVDLGPFFDELARCVRHGGRIALLDVATPKNPILRFGHSIYFGKIVPLVGGAFGSDRSAYRYLPKSVAYMPPPDQMLLRLQVAGFTNVERRLLSGGITQLVTATRV
jgi:demethylmenaquinone methyltransferase / 2-methoxy-6-polyprenyl-1,4-benzoquinol methylase